MDASQNRSGEIPSLAALELFAKRAAAALQQDERVRALWLTGSLVAGTADAQSDVDLRAAVQAEDFVQIANW
jgi:predicted nucleotidyltransferase